MSMTTGSRTGSLDRPAVKEAWETFGQIVLNEAYLYGGSTGTLAINWSDITIPMFTDPAEAFLHHQGNFIIDFFPEPKSKVYGVDYDLFAFPDIKPEYAKAMMGGGGLMVMFNDSPQIRELMQYLATPGIRRAGRQPVAALCQTGR